MKNQKFGRCERCGNTFDTADGYASIEYASVAGDLLLVDDEEYFLGLCTWCELAFNAWLDEGRPPDEKPAF